MERARNKLTVRDLELILRKLDKKHFKLCFAFGFSGIDWDDECGDECLKVLVNAINRATLKKSKDVSNG